MPLSTARYSVQVKIRRERARYNQTNQLERLEYLARKHISNPLGARFYRAVRCLKVRRVVA